MTVEGQEFPYLLQKLQPAEVSSSADFGKYSGRKMFPRSYPKNNSKTRIKDMT